MSINPQRNRRTPFNDEMRYLFVERALISILFELYHIYGDLPECYYDLAGNIKRVNCDTCNSSCIFFSSVSLLHDGNFCSEKCLPATSNSDSDSEEIEYTDNASNSNGLYLAICMFWCLLLYVCRPIVNF
jgi:hypothetical protein